MLTKFLELFNPLPGNHYLHVTKEQNNISDALEKLLLPVQGELNVEVMSDDDLKNAKPFKALPRDNDMVIFQDIFSKHKNQSTILKIAYRTLANTAEIIILEKKSVLDIDTIKVMLEEHEFRTPNHLDILEGYDIVVAKKMHMWGNGL